MKALLKHVEVKTVPKFLQREKEADKSAEQFQDFQGMCTAAPAQKKMLSYFRKAATQLLRLNCAL